MARRPEISQDFIQARRERIMEAAARLIVANGPADTSVAHMVKEGRCARNTFYDLFGNKGHCFESLIEWTGLGALRQIEAAVRIEGDFEGRLRAGVSALLAFAGDHPAQVRAYLSYAPGISPARLEEHRQRFAALLSRDPGSREYFLIGAFEQVLYRRLGDGSGSLQGLLDPLACLVLGDADAEACELPDHHDLLAAA